MKKSITYYLTILVIKLKGIKKSFSKSSVDYKKIRKEDVHYPKGRLFSSNLTSTFKVLNSLITEIKQNSHSDKLLIFIHGGAFISGPAKHHWDSIKYINKHTQLNIWMVDYPKAPEYKISEISNNIDTVYNHALKHYSSNNIILIGDSAGGTIITALTQRLIINKISLPKILILISPVMDAAMTNPKVDSIDKTDPMLSKKGVVSAKLMCVESNNLKDEKISPILGRFNDFPETILFLATNDISYPDQLLAVEKMKKANINLEIITGKGMPHIWPLLPVMSEAKKALQHIVKRLNE